MNTTEDPCTGMGGKDGRGLVPHPPTPLPAGPSTLRVRPEATAEPQLGETFLLSLPLTNLGPVQSLVLYFLELLTPTLGF